MEAFHDCIFQERWHAVRCAPRRATFHSCSGVPGAEAPTTFHNIEAAITLCRSVEMGSKPCGRLGFSEHRGSKRGGKGSRKVLRRVLKSDYASRLGQPKAYKPQVLGEMHWPPNCRRFGGSRKHVPTTCVLLTATDQPPANQATLGLRSPRAVPIRGRRIRTKWVFLSAREVVPYPQASAVREGCLRTPVQVLDRAS